MNFWQRLFHWHRWKIIPTTFEQYRRGVTIVKRCESCGKMRIQTPWTNGWIDTKDTGDKHGK